VCYGIIEDLAEKAFKGGRGPVFFSSSYSLYGYAVVVCGY
jgi:hypothetical protein